ncbi:PREDICTED: wall-associated [Prunus dulcis]|uniref:PREDICTED: wall-associated n=1 Tax=Prunus dulcis TaxID=3755 RepID=A0A5E4FP17_PRUDU|nr:PREDICTED: wall-associated [Prunus dulcis]
MLILRPLRLPGTIFVLATLATATAAAAQALPGCPDYCGDLKVPYPFGTVEGCYLGENFFINCTNKKNTTTSNFTEIPTAYLMGNIVTNISLDGELQILQLVFHDCFYNNDKTGVVHISPTSVSYTLQVSPFTISDTRNKLVSVGCDTFAILEGYRQDEERYESGCLSLCRRPDSVTDSCSGIGCCTASIPSGLKNHTVTVSRYKNHSYGDLRCSYAFIVEENYFKFSNASFLKMAITRQLPMVINWEIGDQPCAAAEKSHNFSCKANSKCINRTNSSGYLCMCLSGYGGNPYHPDGCQDIDECEVSDPCSAVCLNLPGNYSCLCPKGYKGDGLKTGSGCIKYNSIQSPLLINISLGIGIGLVLLLVVIGAWWLQKVIKKRKAIKRKENFFKQNGGILLEQQLSSGEVNVQKAKLFKSEELEKATDQFNVDRILGHGGQGTVYKGMLVDGTIVAVKKSKNIASAGKVRQFINEIVILSQINHRNVVKLLGCCLETEVPLLVYEYIPNGTLYQYIHDQNEEFPLTWEMRLRIALEIAGALSYLHSAASFPIYHRDIKSTNILLDGKYRARIADFGTSRSVSVDQTHLTTSVHGTFGYLDPEYFQSSKFTDKSDVYSFGVVLVELLTGQKAVSLTSSQEARGLVSYFNHSMEENHVLDIFDAQVKEDGAPEETLAVAILAKRCLDMNGKRRPTMKEVAMELEGIQKASDVQLNLEAAEHVPNVVIGAWDDAFTPTDSTGSGWDSGAASSTDVLSILSDESG